MAQEKGVGMVQTWEQRREKKKTGEEERNGWQSASLSADTDQEHQQKVWKREAVWDEQRAQFFLRLHRQSKHLRYPVHSSDTAGFHLKGSALKCQRCSCLLEFPKQLKCHVRCLLIWSRDACLDRSESPIGPMSYLKAPCGCLRYPTVSKQH